MNREEKSRVDLANWHIVEQISREEKKTKLTVSSLLIKELWFDTEFENLKKLSHVTCR